MSAIKCLVYGGRAYSDAPMVQQCLAEFWRINGEFAIIEGGARGADRLARQWGINNGLCVLTSEANWLSYGKTAGHVRNAWMLKYGQPTHAIGFPGGTGTANMTRQLQAAGVWLWLPCP